MAPPLTLNARRSRVHPVNGATTIDPPRAPETPAEQTVIGDAPNLAARLQALAEPGAVLICPRTRRLAGGHFDGRDLGRVALKGRAESVSVSQVLGPRVDASRA